MRESLNDGVLFPDDLTEYGGKSDLRLTVVDPAPIPAEDVDHEDAQFGQWVRVSDGHNEKWACAPEALRRFLADAYDEHGTEISFQVFRADRGEADHDPWQFRARVVEEDGVEVDKDDATSIEQL